MRVYIWFSGDNENDGRDGNRMSVTVVAETVEQARVLAVKEISNACFSGTELDFHPSFSEMILKAQIENEDPNIVLVLGQAYVDYLD